MDKPFILEDARAEYVESYVWYHESGSHIAEAFVYLHFGIISVFPAIHLNCSVDQFTRGGW